MNTHKIIGTYIYTSGGKSRTILVIQNNLKIAGDQPFISICRHLFSLNYFRKTSLYFSYEELRCVQSDGRSATLSWLYADKYVECTQCLKNKGQTKNDIDFFFR